MRRLFPVLLLIASPLYAQTQLSLVPQPASVQAGAETFPLSGGFTIATPGVQDPRLLRAIDRAVNRIEARTASILPRANAPQLIVDVKARGNDIPQLGDDETYTLEITAQQVKLSANQVVGAIRGLETLVQLVAPAHGGFVLPAVTIRDQPRFPWRGLLIDVSRHFETIEFLKRNLDALAAAKMNVFHWHLSDDQGFRIESKRFPKLAGLGSDGLFYTQDQVRDIIRYAADRGIRVVPEFDMPGHATSWMVGYPELASLPGHYAIERRFGVFDPTMDPTRDSTYKFLDAFVAEMARLFPDAYFHVGGDENNGKQWNANPRIQAFMKKRGIETNAQLQTYFNTRLLAIVKKHGKHMVGWDEVLTPRLPKDVVVQSWRGLKTLDQGAQDGYTGILSQPYYFDAMMPADQLYMADPVPANSPLTPEQRARVLGGESCMWSELVTHENIERDIWPRNLAVAERLWSPATVTDVNDFYRRADVVSVGLESLGLHHIDSEARGLRAITGTTIPAAPITTLLKYVEPYRLGLRRRAFETTQTQQTPLTALGDIVDVDKPSRRLITDSVNALLQSAPAFNADTSRLEAAFNELSQLDKTYPSAAAGNPALEKADSRAQDLADLGRAGLEELKIINAGTAVSDQWLSEKLALLDRAEKSTPAALRIAWMPAMRTLTYMAAYRSKAGETTADFWRNKVVADAAPKPVQRK